MILLKLQNITFTFVNITMYHCDFVKFTANSNTHYEASTKSDYQSNFFNKWCGKRL